MFALMLTVLLLCGLFLYRNELVFRARMRRIGEIHSLCTGAFDRHQIPPFDALYAEYEQESHESMLLDLRRWTYAQFYPQPVTLEAI